MSVRRSLAWTYLAQAVNFVVTFGSTVVVARLVSPRDFGIFAMATAATTIINVFMQFGLAKYLMREADPNRDMLRSVFTVNVVMSLVYSGAILMGSLAAGQMLGSVEVGRFFAVFAIFPLFAMMEFIPSALCAREMKFGVIASFAVVRALVMAAVTLVLAYKGFAYMSFAWAQVAAWLATSIGFNIVVWRPDVWRLRFKDIRSILQFGAQMIGITGVTQLGTRAGEMFLGSMLGLAPLGIYNRASSLPITLYATIYAAGSNVMFSRLSRDLRETGELYQTYVRFMRLLLGFMWPMLFGLALLADPVIHILYGNKWQAAAAPLSLLTIATAIVVGIGMTSELFILRNQTGRQVRIEVIRAVAGFLLFAGGVMISLPMAAAAKVVEAGLAFILYRRAMVQMLDGPPGQMRGIYAEAGLLSVAAILPSALLMWWNGWSAETPLLAILVAVAIGGLSWATVLLQRRHPIAREVIRLFRRETDVVAT